MEFGFCDSSARSDSAGVVFDLLSVGLAYPGQAFFETATNGAFAAALIQNLGCLHPRNKDLIPTTLTNALEWLSCCPPQQLESDYLQTFELNPQSPPLHLYAHLYADGGSPVESQRAREALYRKFGVNLRSEGREPADYLPTQLEFHSYLYHRQAVCNSEDAESLEQGLRESHDLLKWVYQEHGLLDAWTQRPSHPFYLPMTELLASLLHTEACQSEA